MRCTNKKRGIFSCLCATLLLFLVGCGNTQFDLPYDAKAAINAIGVVKGKDSQLASSFATNLCIVTEDVTTGTEVDMSKAGAALLVDLQEKDVIYAKAANDKMFPASLTKVMTAVVALQNGSLDQILTAGDSVNITEKGAQLCGLKKGDSMTLAQALHILLMYSANDVANLIAENIGGSVEDFVAMMNAEARRIGATNTHFVNPHGLTDPEHYTTAYDLYLIFNEALKYEQILEIIHMTSYQTTYFDKNQKEKELSFETTNRFLRGHFKAPSNVTVIGGKTGSTNAAGNCLMLLSKDVNGASYISVILRAESNDILYGEMIDLLEEINS